MMAQPPFEMPEIPTADPNPATPAQPEATQITVDRTQIVAPTPQANTTQAITPTQCPICKQHNPPGDNYCVECGFLLSSAPPTEAAPEPKAIPALRDSSGREFLLKEGVNTVGRENADVLLTDARISRRHAQITLASDGIWVEDSGSTNGTKLNGQRLSPGERAAAPPDAEISFGGLALQLSLPEGWAIAQTPASVEEVAVVEETAAADAAPETAAENAPDVVTQEEAVSDVGIQAVIINTSDPVLNQKFELSTSEQSVGRRPENDIVVANPYVSGKHALLVIENGQVFLTDLGSTNGTFLNKKQLDPNVKTLLSDGDQVTFGQAEFTLEVTPLAPPIGEEAGSVEPPADSESLQAEVEPGEFERRQQEGKEAAGENE